MEAYSHAAVEIDSRTHDGSCHLGHRSCKRRLLLQVGNARAGVQSRKASTALYYVILGNHRGRVRRNSSVAGLSTYGSIPIARERKGVYWHESHKMEVGWTVGTAVCSHPHRHDRDQVVE